MTRDDVEYDIVIVGAGGFGRELLAWCPDCFPSDRYRIKGFLANTDDDVVACGETSFPILGSPESYCPKETERFLLAIGDVAARRRIVESLRKRRAEFLTMIHPTAVIAPTVSLGKGTVVYPNVVLANGAVLDDFVLMSNFASAGHDSRAGRYCNLCPYATLNGAAVLEDEVFVGTHATVGPGVRVGRGSRISANTAVLRNAPRDSFVFGVPGKTVPVLRTS